MSGTAAGGVTTCWLGAMRSVGGAYFSESEDERNSSSDEGCVDSINNAPSSGYREISGMVYGEYFASSSEEDSREEAGEGEGGGSDNRVLLQGKKDPQETAGNMLGEEVPQGDSDSDGDGDGGGEHSSSRLSPRAGPAAGM